MIRISKIIFLEPESIRNVRLLKRFVSSGNIANPTTLFGDLSSEPIDKDKLNQGDGANPVVCQIGDVDCLFHSPVVGLASNSEDPSIKTNTTNIKCSNSNPTLCSPKTTEDTSKMSTEIKTKLPKLPVPPVIPKNVWKNRATQDGVFHSHGIKIFMPSRLRSPELAKTRSTGIPTATTTNNEIGGDIRILDFKRALPDKY